MFYIQLAEYWWLLILEGRINALKKFLFLNRIIDAYERNAKVKIERETHVSGIIILFCFVVPVSDKQYPDIRDMTEV